MHNIATSTSTKRKSLFN